MSLTQAKWAEMVRKVVREWFAPSENGARAGDHCSRWESVCGQSGARLEEALTDRDASKVLEIVYLLAKGALEESRKDTPGYSELERVRDFLEDLERRLKMPRLELKHIWYAEQWHDYDSGSVAEFVQQDLDRASICLAELRRGTYQPVGGYAWPWTS